MNPKRIEFANDGRGRIMTAEIADGIASSAGIATSEKSIAEEGDLVVEFYNCSSEVYEALSSDHSYVTLVSHRDKRAMADVIRTESEPRDEEDDWLILNFLSRTFTHHTAVNDWLLGHGIPFRRFHDSGWGLGEEPANA